MADRPTLDEILESNPNIDRKQLEKGRDLLREIREAGTKGAGYRLASPGDRRRAVVGADPSDDSRNVRLRANR